MKERITLNTWCADELEFLALENQDFFFIKEKVVVGMWGRDSVTSYYFYTAEQGRKRSIQHGKMLMLKFLITYFSLEQGEMRERGTEKSPMGWLLPRCLQISGLTIPKTESPNRKIPTRIPNGKDMMWMRKTGLHAETFTCWFWYTSFNLSI